LGRPKTRKIGNFYPQNRINVLLDNKKKDEYNDLLASLINNQNQNQPSETRNNNQRHANSSNILPRMRKIATPQAPLTWRGKIELK